jgi:multiple sugar transport system permease protein
MYHKTIFDQDYGYGAAIAVILFVIMLFFIAIFIQQMIRRDEET